MAILNIRRFPDPLLRQKSKRVRVIDKSIKKLIADMTETLHAANGVGLAAPQVGVLLRVIVISIPEQEGITLINPQILRRSGDRTVTEGCLCLPGYNAQIKRSERVTAKALDPSGKEVRIKADGLLAQALEHETDHLNGVLFVDYLNSMDELHKIEPEEIETGEKAGVTQEDATASS